MKKVTRCLFLFIMILSLDQIIKHEIRHLGGFYVCNHGISFNLNLPLLNLWLILALFAVIFIYIKYFFHKSLLLTIGSGLFFAGAFSNLLDRFFVGCVTDYINLNIHFLPVFNLADISITIGSCIIFYSLFKKQP